MSGVGGQSNTRETIVSGIDLLSGSDRTCRTCPDVLVKTCWLAQLSLQTYSSSEAQMVKF